MIPLVSILHSLAILSLYFCVDFVFFSRLNVYQCFIDALGSVYMETGSRWDPSHSPTWDKFVESLHETRQVTSLK